MNTNEPTSRKPLRLWPGVAAAVLLVLFGYVIAHLRPSLRRSGDARWAFGRRADRHLWWLLFSRARWSERLGASS